MPMGLMKKDMLTSKTKEWFHFNPPINKQANRINPRAYKKSLIFIELNPALPNFYSRKLSTVTEKVWLS